MDMPSTQVLTTKRRFIKQNLRPVSVTRILHGDGVLAHNEALRITSEEERGDQTRELMSVLRDRDVYSMDALLRALHKTGQGAVHRALLRPTRTARLWQQNRHQTNARLVRRSSAPPRIMSTDTGGVDVTSYASLGHEDVTEHAGSVTSQSELQRSRVTSQPRDLTDECLLVFGVQDGHGMRPDIIAVRLRDLRSATLGVLGSASSPANSGMACTELLGAVYVAALGDAMNEIWRYDLVTGAQARCGYLIKEGRCQHAMVSVGRQVYVLGGLVAGRADTSVEVYDALSGASRPAGDLVRAVYGAASAVHQASVYVYGGYSQPMITVDAVQCYDVTTQQTSLLRPLLSAAGHLQCHQWGRYSLLVGQWHCFLYDTQTEHCARRSSYHTGVSQFALLPVTSTDDVNLVIVGGRDTFSQYSQVIKTTSLSHVIADRKLGWQSTSCDVTLEPAGYNAQTLTRLPSCQLEHSFR